MTAPTATAPQTLAPGALIRVPAGADATRALTYYGRVISVELAGGESGYTHLRIAKTNAAGKPTRRRGADVTVYAIVDPAQVAVIHQPAA